MISIKRTVKWLFIFLISGNSAFSQGNNEPVNLLLNPYFDFHSFINHRDGEAVSYSSGNVAFWNTDAWGEIMEFTLPFKSRPLVICSGGLAVKNEDVTETKVKFIGTSGSYEVIGE